MIILSAVTAIICLKNNRIKEETMTETKFFAGLNDRSHFSRDELLNSFRAGGYTLSSASFYKKVQEMLKAGEIIRVGRNVYCLPSEEKAIYEHLYSALSLEIADILIENYPYMDFSIFELVQLNDFVNHQIAHNVIYLSVDPEVTDFVFDTLKERYPGKVLLNPSVEFYHQYWTDNMIVLGKLITEAPKGQQAAWHTKLEKMLVDIMSEPLIQASVGESEYPTIYEDAFMRYLVDEGCMFRYAKRRNADKKIRKLICEKTNIELHTKG